MIPPRRTRSFRPGGVSLPAGLGALTRRLPRLAARVAAKALGSLNPCPVCGKAAPSAVVCPECDELLTRALGATSPRGDTLWLGPYAGPLLRMVHALKFGGQRAFAAYLGRHLAQQVRRAGWRPDCVTFVPASSAKLRARGFDQAELLAGSVAAELGAECRTLLARSAPGAVRGSQVALGRSARSANAEGAYLATGARRLTVLLIDDVMTSGATLAACRTALEEAGAKSVSAAVVARTVRSESDVSEHDDDGGQDP